MVLHLRQRRLCSFNPAKTHLTPRVVATSIELDPTIEARLDQLAQSTGRNKAFSLNELISHGMDDLEDLYLAGLELE